MISVKHKLVSHVAHSIKSEEAFELREMSRALSSREQLMHRLEQDAKACNLRPYSAPDASIEQQIQDFRKALMGEIEKCQQLQAAEEVRQASAYCQDLVSV